MDAETIRGQVERAKGCLLGQLAGDALHAGSAARSAHGIRRRRLRGLLPLSPPRGSGARGAVMAETNVFTGFSCPVPRPERETVLLGHGSGGRHRGCARLSRHCGCRGTNHSFQPAFTVRDRFGKTGDLTAFRRTKIIGHARVEREDGRRRPELGAHVGDGACAAAKREKDRSIVT